MSKRFGRNQRRKMRNQLERQKTDAARQIARASDEIARLRNRLAKSIEIDVDVLRDHSRFAYEARLSAYSDGRESWHIAQRIDAREIVMQQDRERFIEHVSTIMARSLARTLGDKWGSGRNPYEDTTA